jgi:hypothetical protein
MIGIWELIIVAAVFLACAFVLAAAAVAIIFVVRANHKERHPQQPTIAPPGGSS